MGTTVAPPDEDGGVHLKLHDGEVVVVPPPTPFHSWLQAWLTDWLTEAARPRGRAAAEFPYRPAANLQFWRADVAYLPHEDWLRQRSNEYVVYCPPLIVEILSPSNREEKVNRQGVIAFSDGTREFWVVDPVRRTVEVSVLGQATRIYGLDDEIRVSVLPEAVLPVRLLFEGHQ